MLAKRNEMSVDIEEVGNGHMQISDIACTDSNECGGAAITLHSNFFTDGVSTASSIGFS